MSIKSAENYQKKSMENFEEFENDIININSEFSDLELKTLKSEVSNENKEIEDYNKYPYINEQDYQMYFAPETFNFKQFGI
jgi:predicted HTH domain antitoxin